MEDAEVTSEVTARALSRISVRPPYFGLGELETAGEGIVAARIGAAPPSAPEVGAMEAAQVARHLAILGSCAAALSRDDDKRHHYLATKAHFARLWNGPRSNEEPLRAEAVASWVDRRTARALIKLSTEAGHGLNMLDVEYTVLAPKVFERLHPPVDEAALAKTSLDQTSPDVTGVDGGSAASDLPFEVEQTGNGVLVRCGRIPRVLCDGHFPNYPAAPVAIVMGQLCRAAGMGLVHHLGHEDFGYRIEEGHVTAQKLATAGQELVLEATYEQPVPGGHQLRGVALADGESVGELTVTLSTHTLEPDTDADASELETMVGP